MTDEELAQIGQEIDNLDLQQCKTLLRQILPIMMQQNAKLLMQDKLLLDYANTANQVNEASKWIEEHKFDLQLAAKYRNILWLLELNCAKVFFTGTNHLPQA